MVTDGITEVANARDGAIQWMKWPIRGLRSRVECRSMAEQFLSEVF
jgi:hypothetical protein